jgi:hypothetical protein
MDLVRFYQGYSGHKNYFFAPASLRKPKKKMGDCYKQINVLGNSDLHRIITSNGQCRESRSRYLQRKDVITPESLSFHIQKRKLDLTPFPRMENRYQSRAGDSSTFRIRGKTKILKIYRNSMVDEDYMPLNLNIKINLNLPTSYTSTQNAEVQT